MLSFFYFLFLRRVFALALIFVFVLALVFAFVLDVDFLGSKSLYKTDNVDQCNPYMSSNLLIFL